MRKKQSITENPERFLYHSFPRRWRDNPALEKKQGLTILQSIIERGLLLVPEDPENLMWREPLTIQDSGENILSDPWFIMQICCSFTDLTPLELSRHSQIFGRFALEFEFSTIRQLGGVPVLYLPRPSSSKKDVGPEWITATLMARIGEVQILLKNLSNLEKKLKDIANKENALEVTINEQVKGHIQCSISGAEDLLRLLRLKSSDKYIRPYNELQNSLQWLSGFFYPTERKIEEPLSYYQHREWRITANMMKLKKKKEGEGFDYQSIDRAIEKLEKDVLLEIDRNFFEKILKFREGDLHRRVDKCKFSQGLDGKPLICSVRRIIVPRDTMEEVSGLIEEIEDAPTIVAIETL